MAQPDDTELVRRAYDAWNWYGIDALRPFLSADVRLQDAPELPDAGDWEGVDAVIGRLDAVAEAVGGGWVEIRDIRPSGDVILVHLVWRIDDAGEGALLDDVFHLVGVSDGALSSMQIFLTESAAVEASSGSS